MKTGRIREIKEEIKLIKEQLKNKKLSSGWRINLMTYMDQLDKEMNQLMREKRNAF